VSELTFLEQFAAKYAWDQAPAKRRFRFRKRVNRGMEEGHRLALTLGGVIDRALDDDEGLQSSDYSTYQIFEKDDLVFKLIDLENIKTSRVGYVPRRGIMSPAYIRLQPSSPMTFSRYYYWFFYGAYLNNIFNGMGGGVRQNLTPTDLLEFPVPLPDRDTQKAISDFLDRETARIDQLVEKKQRLVGLLDERFEATVTSLTSPSSDQSSDWLERPIKALCTVFGRIGFRGYTTEDIVDEGEGAITLSPSNIKGGRMSLADRTYLSWHKYYESPEIQISSGDIVFVKTGSTIGKVAKVDDIPEPMTLNPQLVVLKNIVPDSDFLLFAMQSKTFQYQVSFNRFGGSTPAMSQGNLGRLRIWLPQSKEEQRRRANEIIEERHQIEKMKELLISTVGRLQELRSALITAAVTGQIDVTTWGKQGQTDRRLDEIEEAMQA